MQPFHHFANVCNGGGSHLDAVRPHVCDQPLSCAASLSSGSCFSHVPDTGARQPQGKSEKAKSKAAPQMHTIHMGCQCAWLAKEKLN